MLTLSCDSSCDPYLHLHYIHFVAKTVMNTLHARHFFMKMDICQLDFIRSSLPCVIVCHCWGNPSVPFSPSTSPGVCSNAQDPSRCDRSSHPGAGGEALWLEMPGTPKQTPNAMAGPVPTAETETTFFGGPVEGCLSRSLLLPGIVVQHGPTVKQRGPNV